MTENRQPTHNLTDQAYLSRRELIIKGTPALLFGLPALLEACASSPTTKAPEISDYELYVRNIRGHVAASTVLLADTPNPEDFTHPNQFTFGHGGLFYINGQPWLLSLKHVVRPSAGKGLVAMFPGIPDIPKWEKIPTAPHWMNETEPIKIPDSSGTDGIEGIQLDLTQYDSVRQAVNNGLILPLTAASINKLPQGKMLGLTRFDGHVAQVQFTGINNGFGQFSFGNMDDMGGCHGQSGTALLELDAHGKTPGRSFGLFARLNDPGQCGLSGGFIPHKAS